jgi:hypothetical protein
MRLSAQIGWINAYKTKIKVNINAYNYVLSLCTILKTQTFIKWIGYTRMI